MNPIRAMRAESLLNALTHPRAAMRSVFDRLVYPNYKYMVGPPGLYDELGRHQFEIVRSWGLLPEDSLLDIGCGSLRAGRFFIQYLLPGNYAGIEPDRRLIEDGLKYNLDAGTLQDKRPTFDYNAQFELTVFGRKFDFLLAHSIFTHAPLRLIGKCLAEGRSVMHSASLFFATYNRGTSDYTGDEWVAPGRPTKEARGAVWYTSETLCRVAAEHALDCVELNVRHPTGGTWLLFYDHANQSVSRRRGGH